MDRTRVAHLILPGTPVGWVNEGNGDLSRTILPRALPAFDNIALGQRQERQSQLMLGLRR